MSLTSGNLDVLASGPTVLHCLLHFLVDLAVTLQIWLVKAAPSLAEAAHPFVVWVLAWQLFEEYLERVAEVACDGNDNAALCVLSFQQTRRFSDSSDRLTEVYRKWYLRVI